MHCIGNLIQLYTLLPCSSVNPLVCIAAAVQLASRSNKHMQLKVCSQHEPIAIRMTWAKTGCAMLLSNAISSNRHVGLCVITYHMEQLLQKLSAAVHIPHIQQLKDSAEAAQHIRAMCKACTRKTWITRQHAPHSFAVQYGYLYYIRHSNLQQSPQLQSQLTRCDVHVLNESCPHTYINAGWLSIASAVQHVMPRQHMAPAVICSLASQVLRSSTSLICICACRQTLASLCNAQQMCRTQKLGLAICNMYCLSGKASLAILKSALKLTTAAWIKPMLLMWRSYCNQCLH